MAAGLGLFVLCLPRLASNLLRVEKVCQNEEEAAYRYCRQHPGEAYFPWNPAPALFAEGKLHHFDYGVFDRNLADFPVGEEHFRKYVPDRMRRVCYPRGPLTHAVDGYLGDYSRRAEVQELPG